MHSILPHSPKITQPIPFSPFPKVVTKMTEYIIMDTRHFYKKYSVLDDDIYDKNPYAWHDAVVFQGTKAECEEWIRGQIE